MNMIIRLTPDYCTDCRLMLWHMLYVGNEDARIIDSVLLN